MEKIQYEGTGERIDSWLAKHFLLSRNFFQHILKRGGVQINNKPTKKSYQLVNGDQISIDDFQRFLDQQAMEETPNISIPILYETPDYLVINKPKGVLAHPKTIWELHEPSVAGFLFHRYKNLPSIGNFIRAGILHRLDKMTDGLMIIAKTEKGLAHFKSLFQQKSEGESLEDKESALIKKCYRATCYITSQGASFLHEISENLPWYIKSLVIPKTPHPVPKIGITKILGATPSADGKQVAMDLEILTGRTHQIRFHLSQAGLPIIGDYLYGTEDIQDMQLTAYKLVFQDLEGNMQCFEI